MARPGGLVAVLEDDTLHQILLPWPIEVELAVRRAEWEALRDDSDHPRKYYVGRRLVGVFREAGLVDLRVDAFASTRVAPLDEHARSFASESLRKLRERVSPRLEPGVSQAFDKLANPGSPDFLPDQPDLCLTVVDHLIQGQVPFPSASGKGRSYWRSLNARNSNSSPLAQIPLPVVVAVLPSSE